MGFLLKELEQLEAKKVNEWLIQLIIKFYKI